MVYTHDVIVLSQHHSLSYKGSLGPGRCGCWSVAPKGGGFDPGRGAYPGCRIHPQLGRFRKQLVDVSLSLSLSLPSSLPPSLPPPLSLLVSKISYLKNATWESKKTK